MTELMFGLNATVSIRKSQAPGGLIASRVTWVMPPGLITSASA